MQRIFKIKGTLLGLYMCLPITPSVAAITIFLRSYINDSKSEVSTEPPRTIRVIDPSRNL